MDPCVDNINNQSNLNLNISSNEVKEHNKLNHKNILINDKNDR